ncbi:ParA family protein [Aquipuribacter hungaricus]|uniref:ParA family protein n=1 Tax=Aquipuribacter hungaricus TaxID=545624 RepID=UPI00361E73FE
MSLAMVAAEEGRDVVLVDLDPRAASTKWTGVEPTSKGLHVGAILADEDPAGWADEARCALCLESPPQSHPLRPGRVPPGGRAG